MKHLCPTCGSDDCECGQRVPSTPHVWPSRLLAVLSVAAVLACVGMMIAWSIDAATEAARFGMAPTTPQPTVVITLIVTATPAVITPSPTSSPTPAPTHALNGAVEADVDADGLAHLAAVIQVEAGGMGKEGKYLIACNVLHDLYDVGGDWERLIGRWAKLEEILSGSPPREPTSGDFSVAGGAADGTACYNYPRCRFVGSTLELYGWEVDGYVDPGVYDLWLARSGQMLACVRGTPDLPGPPGK